MTTQWCDYRLEIDRKKFKSECYFPGVTYDDFDRAGNLSPWKMSRMFQAGRSIPMRQGNFMDFTELMQGSGSTYFVLGGVYYFDPSLWGIARRHQYFPYKIINELVGLGQTSFTIRETLFNLLDTKELATFVCKLVYVDRTTRRPQPFPSWYRQKYQDVPSNDIQIDVARSNAPGTAFTTQFTVTASDTDENGHTNQATYIRYCLDIAEQARRDSRLQSFTKDICLYPITQISVLYKGETLSGDKLRGSVWEIDLNPGKLHYVIRRENDVVFVATFDFTDISSSKL